MNKQARSWIPSILLLIVLFVGGYWFMTRQFTINNSYSQQDFYESVQNNEVESVYIHPNKEYPTGRESVIYLKKAKKMHHVLFLSMRLMR